MILHWQLSHQYLPSFYWSFTFTLSCSPQNTIYIKTTFIRWKYHLLWIYTNEDCVSTVVLSLSSEIQKHRTIQIGRKFESPYCSSSPYIWEWYTSISCGPQAFTGIVVVSWTVGFPSHWIWRQCANQQDSIYHQTCLLWFCCVQWCSTGCRFLKDIHLKRLFLWSLSGSLKSTLAYYCICAFKYQTISTQVR